MVAHWLPGGYLSQLAVIAQSGISARLKGVRPSLGARSSVAEHLTFNQGVDGSIPSGPTIDFKHLRGAPIGLGARLREFCGTQCATSPAKPLALAGLS